MLLPLVVLAVIALVSLQRVTHAVDDVVQEATQELATVLRLQIMIQRALIVTHDSLVPPHGEPLDPERVSQASSDVDAAFEQAIAGPFALAGERTLVVAARDAWRQGRQVGHALAARAFPREGATVADEIRQLHSHVARALEMLDQVQALAQEEMNDQLANAATVRRGVLVGIGSVFLLGLGAAAMVGTGLARSIISPLRVLETGAHRFGTGDLTHRVPMTGEDELAQLARTFNVMADRLAESQAALKDLSTRDSLTGLVNYREFHRQLTEEVERFRRYRRPFSLLMLDIDHFKEINDTYGHLAGDEALRALAALLQGVVRPTDLVARYGGEEFVMLLPETAGPGALTLAERLRTRVADHAVPLTAEQSKTLTVSIGLATYPEDGDSVQTLVNAADRALYAAKAGGRNQARRSGVT